MNQNAPEIVCFTTGKISLSSINLQKLRILWRLGLRMSTYIPEILVLSDILLRKVYLMCKYMS